MCARTTMLYICLFWKDIYDAMKEVNSEGLMGKRMFYLYFCVNIVLTVNMYCFYNL